MSEGEGEARTRESSSPRRVRLAVLASLAKDFALALLLALFVLIFLFQPFRVDGESMLPRFQDHERIIVNKLSYRLGEIQRGDVVVFWFPADANKSFVKRVVGMPGEVVEIQQGRVHINGELLEEDYVPEEFRLREDHGPMLVRRGYYYVLGDHRTRSYDSRAWGLVPERYIYGKAVLTYWPPRRVGLVQ
jgi:signal peptidase I